jgi:hypothetical protein
MPEIVNFKLCNVDLTIMYTATHFAHFLLCSDKIIVDYIIKSRSESFCAKPID